MSSPTPIRTPRRSRTSRASCCATSPTRRRSCLQLQKGDADIARDLGADQLKSIAGNKDLTISASPQGTSMYIAMNQSMAELQKVQVHQAIKWAIDYDAIAQNITPNTWSVCQAFLPYALPGALKQNPFQEGRGEGEGAAGRGRAGRTASR